jgi:hypothetical protein
MEEMIKAVRAHANINYEKHGIGQAIGSAKTVKGAIANCKRQVKILDLYRRERMGGWW